MGTVRITEDEGQYTAVHEGTGLVGSGETEATAILDLARTMSQDAERASVTAQSGEIRLERTDLGWVATDPEREVSSAPMASRAAALDDLDENVALADGDLEVSDEVSEAIEASEADLERGETVAHDDLKRELGPE